MADIVSLQNLLGVKFGDPALLEQALVHSSYLNEYPGEIRVSNERLEFLGDAVLGLVVAEKLYQDFPDLTEGEMTKIRAILVRRETLAKVAGGLKLGDYLYLGKGEEATGGRGKPANLAGAFEAVIAAVYFDQGMIAVKKLVLRLLAGEFEQVLGRRGEVDYKSRLQELVQAQHSSPPVYRTIQATGPDHDKLFIVEVLLEDRVLGKGSGKSKKLAEVDAARDALTRSTNDFT
jgi:ribonuclease-3